MVQSIRESTKISLLDPFSWKPILTKGRVDRENLTFLLDAIFQNCKRYDEILKLTVKLSECSYSHYAKYAKIQENVSTFYLQIPNYFTLVHLCHVMPKFLGQFLNS